MPARAMMTRMTRIAGALLGAALMGNYRVAHVPVTVRQENAEIARDRGEWYLHTVIGR